jgi:hypothetical protein
MAPLKIAAEETDDATNPTTTASSESSSSSTSTTNLGTFFSLRGRNPALHPTRESTPYPHVDDSTADASPYQHQSLAETAANAQLQLQQQINLMAQVCENI